MGPIFRHESCIAVYGTTRDEIVSHLRRSPGVTRVYPSYSPTSTITVSFDDYSIDVWHTGRLDCTNVGIWSHPDSLAPRQVFDQLHAALPNRMEVWLDTSGTFVDVADRSTRVGTEEYYSELDDIFDGLTEHLQGVLPDATLESADMDWQGDTWQAIVYLINCAFDTGRPINSQTINLIRRTVDLVDDKHLGQNTEGDIYELEWILTKLKQRGLTPAQGQAPGRS
jgi:hypothetical protein